MQRIRTGSAAAAGLSPEDLPQDIPIRDTGTTRFIFNHGPKPVTYKGVTLAPAGVI